MCLILAAWHARKDYPCLIAANRDESHARPAAAASWWDGDDIFAGRDLLAGGTWLGTARSGRFAALTNYRGAARREGAPSRGALVAKLLAASRSTTQTLDYLRGISSNYAGFNLIFSDGERLAVFESTTGVGRELGLGIYALSNHLLDTPWPKVLNAKSALSSALHALPDTTAIVSLLRDDRAALDHQLPRTGVSLAWERLLSSAFILGEDYGTRCSTIFSIDAQGGARFDEWTWDRHGDQSGHVHEAFKIISVLNPPPATT